MKRIVFILALLIPALAQAEIANNPGFSPCGAIQRVAKSNLQGQVWAGWITQAQADAEFERIAAECPDPLVVKMVPLDQCMTQIRAEQARADYIKQVCGKRCAKL